MSDNPSSEALDALIEACHEEAESVSRGWMEIPQKSVLAADEAAYGVCTEAFFNDRIDILDVFNEKIPYEREPYTNLSYTAIMQQIVQYITLAIISHTHTETIRHIILTGNIFKLFLNEDLFAAAVYSGNYQIADCMQQIREFDVDVKMMDFLMKDEKYEKLDMILDYGKRLRQSNLIKNIILEVTNTENVDMLKMIRFLAERYAPLFDGSDETEGDFVAENSDVDNLIAILYEYVYNAQCKGAEIVLEYFIRIGLKLSDASKAIAAGAESIDIYDDRKNFISNCMVNMVNENTYICYEDIMAYSRTHLLSEDVWLNNFKQLISHISKKQHQSIRLSVCNKNSYPLTSKNIALLKHLLEKCRVEAVSEIAADSVIDYAIMENKHTVIRAILESIEIAPHVIEYMIDICIRNQSYKCLNELNKYCTKERKNNNVYIQLTSQSI